jgi:hypothetical protein
MEIRELAGRRGTIHPFKVGGDGKPVEIRRGPATVIRGRRSHKPPLATSSRREGAAGRPVSQETSRRPPADMPSWKGVALMHRKTVVALVGATVVALASGSAALAASSGPAVSVQIKSLNKTLLKPTTEHGETGWITKGGTPKGKCSGDSAAGALDAATHGKWAGKYYASVGGIFVTSIDGVKPAGNDYWSLYVNGKPSSKGVCDIKLKSGQKLLFKEIK